MIKNWVSPTTKAKPEFVAFYRFAVYGIYANYAVNPFVYYVSIKSFRTFVQGKYYSSVNSVNSFFKKIRNKNLKRATSTLYS